MSLVNDKPTENGSKESPAHDLKADGKVETAPPVGGGQQKLPPIA